ncbi:MAG: hypothetical protein IKC47_03480 [Clostridia bacterium]|nr:hypothetical protein [Clostridia bacterium]
MKQNYLSKSFDVTTSCVDANNVATCKYLLQICQDVAVLHADHLGYGWKALASCNTLWVVSKVAVQVHTPVMLNDVVTVTTWPVVPNRFVADRHYQIHNGNGQLVAEAISRWCIIDYTTRKMVNPKDVSQRFYDGDYLDKICGAQFEGQKIVLDDTFSESYSRQIRWSDLDLNRHVNNTKYADFAVDCLDEKTLDGTYAGKFEVTYHGECHLGDMLKLYSSLKDGHHRVLGQKDGANCFTFVADYKKL